MNKKPALNKAQVTYDIRFISITNKIVGLQKLIDHKGFSDTDKIILTKELNYWKNKLHELQKGKTS